MAVKWTSDADRDAAIDELIAIQKSENRQPDEFTVREYRGRYNAVAKDGDEISHSQARRQLEKRVADGLLTSRMALVAGMPRRVYRRVTDGL